MTADPFEAAMNEAFPGTARRLLERLLRAGCVADGYREDCCFYCGRMVALEDVEHAADCPYVEAVVLFGDPNYPGPKPTGILRA